MENVLESLSPLTTAVHDEDFAGLGGHSEGHLNSDVEEELARAGGVPQVGDDEDDDGPVNNIVVPPTLGADDEDDPITGLGGVTSAPDPSQVLQQVQSEVSGLGESVVGEDEDDDAGQQVMALEQVGNVVTLEDGSLVQAAEQEGILLTTDGNLAVPVSADHVIRFLMQTSDGNVVAANAPMEAIKLSMPGLLGTEGGEVIQTIQSLSLPDGTLIGNTQPKEEPAEEGEAPAMTGLPKFVEGQTIKLEDGTTALLQATPPEAMNEGLQAIQLEDGSTAFISQAHSENLFPGAVHQLDTSLHLEQLANQTMLAAVERQSEKALVIGDKAYKCMYEDCGRLYTTHHHLKVHERSHTGDRPFRCEFPNCGKTFATGYGLKSHNRVHTGEKPYPCPHTDKGCEKAFKTSGDLQKHVRTHTGERPFKCPFEGCNQSFTTSNIRKVHIRTHTGERPYVCDVEGCGRAFASATNYKNHIRIHTGEKPYVCSFLGCGKRFTEYSSLYKHHVVHTHTKPYTCHCGKTYRQTSTLAMHKRTAHGEDPTVLVHPSPGENGLPPEPEEPPTKRRHIKQERANQQPEAAPQGHLLVNASDGSQMVLLAQSVNPSTAITATTTTTISNGTTSPEDVATEQPKPTSLVDLQQHLPGLASLAGLQHLPSLTLADSGQQVLVVTDPAQLEALQQLASQFETISHTSEGLSQTSGGATHIAVATGGNTEGELTEFIAS